MWKTIISILLLCCVVGCEQLPFNSSLTNDSGKEFLGNKSQSHLSEVAVPQTINKLKLELAKYSPLVKIISPQRGETFERDSIEIELDITDFPLFKDERLGLGNHLVLAIDNQTLPPIYDLEQPIVLKDLTPGTHTLRALAVMPWGESFKTQGAYAQTNFNILTETNSNYPDANLPLLTYNSPFGTYGAEPILLDFYLDYPQSVSGANYSQQDHPLVKATINGTSFTMEKWQPYYLTGFKPGENWVQLELIDESGQSIENTFNNTVRVFNYDPQQQDTLSQLVSDRLTLAEAKPMVEQNYYIQPVETTEITDSIDSDQADKSEFNSEQSDNQSSTEELLIENAPSINSQNEIDNTPEISKETSVADSSATNKSESNLSQSSTIVETETTEVQFSPSTEPSQVENPPKSVTPKSLTQKDVPISSATSNTEKEQTEIELNSEATSIDIELNTESPSRLEIKNSATEPLPVAKSRQLKSTAPLAASNLNSNQSRNSTIEDLPNTVATEKSAPTVTVEEDAIALSPPVNSEILDTEPEAKFLWWKKLLVGIRQQLESLARKLPNEV